MALFIVNFYHNYLFAKSVLSEKLDNKEYQDEVLDSDQENTVEKTEWQKALSEAQTQISDWIVQRAEKIDLFLVGAKESQHINTSSMRIQNTSFSNEGEEASNVTNISVNLKLPNLEEILHLKFATYDELDAERGVNKDYLKSNQKETNYGTSLGLFGKLGNIKAAFQPRIQFQNPLRVTQSLSFTNKIKKENYSIDPKLEFWADPNKGVGIFSLLNYGFPITRKLQFNIVNDANYEEKSHLLSVTNGVTFDQWVNRKNSLLYSFLLTSLNQPNYHLDSYSLALTWNRLIYMRILDAQLTPHLDFNRNKQYKGNLGITLNLNLNF